MVDFGFGFTVVLDGALLLLELATELMRPSSLVMVTRAPECWQPDQER